MSSSFTGSVALNISGGTLSITNSSDLGPTQSPYYFFHGFAGNQIAGDPVFYDMSGAMDNAVFGTQLISSVAWGNNGYISTQQPASASFTGTISGTTLTVVSGLTGTITIGQTVTGTGVTAGTYIVSGSGSTWTVNLSQTVASTTISTSGTNASLRMPALNLDYLGGEKLILWWLGRIATPAATLQIMGDGASATYHGLNVRATTAGKWQLNLVDGTNSIFSGTSVGVPFDGGLHSFGFVIDGTAKQYGAWTDELYDTNLGGNYAALGGGTAVDTRTTNTFNIGTAFPAVANSTSGTIVQTRALAILRLPSATATPSIATVTALFQQLRANPGQLVTNSAF
ncbi:MAG TPA: hypothetical protein VFT64_05020 [Rickettsiales bacterium]|nr:hypothetical protein [Rickettsiales bacterium]